MEITVHQGQEKKGKNKTRESTIDIIKAVIKNHSALSKQQ